MKLWPWGLLLIGLIGIAAATVVVTVTQQGAITVVQPGLIWVTAPNLANIQLPLGGTFTVPFTAKNNGGLDLTLSCSSDIPVTTGITVSCTGITGPLTAGAQVSANIVFTASNTASASNLAFTFTLNGSTP